MTTEASSSWSPEGYLSAWRFAAERHEGQLFPGTTLPYLVHISAVCMEVMAALQIETVTQPDLAIQCALLHDVVEDTGTTLAEVASLFGDDVAAGVDALTKRAEAGPTKSERMADSLQRIRTQATEVWMVKLADRITNLQRPPSHWTTDKCIAYRAEAGTILEALGPASPVLAQRLLSKIEHYGSFIESRLP